MLCVVGGSATGRFLNKSVKQDEEILTLAAAGGCDGVVYGRHSPSSWNCRNDVVFKKVGNTNFLLVFIKATHWIRDWSYLLPVDQRALMDYGCTRLERVARDLYNLGGWRLFRRLQDA